ncbi:MAG: hypothetical protein GKR96_06740 [Gammaproteobacteria bacterium]|nr:hypothetical protein [Gammaproteobacteria bacterium]
MVSSDHRIDIFIGSPSDVQKERDVFFDVLVELNSDPLVPYTLHGVGWDRGLYQQDTWVSPQKAIDSGLLSPEQCDVAIFILWGRIGTPLPKNEYPEIECGRTFTGTEWEFNSAMVSREKNGVPLVLTFRCDRKVEFDAEGDDPIQFSEQIGGLRGFFDRLNSEEGRHERNVLMYSSVESYRTQLKQQLQIFVRDFKGKRIDRALTHGKDRQPNRVPVYIGNDDWDERLRVYNDWLLRKSAELVQLPEDSEDSEEAASAQLPQVYVPALVPSEKKSDLSDRRFDNSDAHDKALERLGVASLYLAGAPGGGESTFCQWVSYVVARGEVPANVDDLQGYAETLPESLMGTSCD